MKSSNGQVPGAVDVSASLRNTMPNFVVMAVTVMAAAWRLLPLFWFSVADFTLKISHRRSDLTVRLSRLRGGPKHLDIFWKPTQEEMGPTIPSEVTTLHLGLYGVEQSLWSHVMMWSTSSDYKRTNHERCFCRHNHEGFSICVFLIILDFRILDCEVNNYIVEEQI